jgi:hypothetical protein
MIMLSQTPSSPGQSGTYRRFTPRATNLLADSGSEKWCKLQILPAAKSAQFGHKKGSGGKNPLCTGKGHLRFTA